MKCHNYLLVNNFQDRRTATAAEEDEEEQPAGAAAVCVRVQKVQSFTKIMTIQDSQSFILEAITSYTLEILSGQ